MASQHLPIPTPQIISLIPPAPVALPVNTSGVGTHAPTHSNGDRADGTQAKGNDANRDRSGDNGSHDDNGHGAASADANRDRDCGNASAANTTPVPDINIQAVNGNKGNGVKGNGAKQKASPGAIPGIADIRERWVQEFLQARSLSKNSQKAYRQDLERFMDWTPLSWSQVTGRQVAQFKAHLIEAQLAPATINRVLSTLKNFYAWMVDSDQMTKDPTKAVHLLPLAAPEAQDLGSWIK